ncbi:MAG: hypothetical protein ACRDHE_03575, partial [Ktedonobacterales bacterium]
MFGRSNWGPAPWLPIGVAHATMCARAATPDPPFGAPTSGTTLAWRRPMSDSQQRWLDQQAIER